MFIFEQFIDFFNNSQQIHPFKIWGVKENTFTVSLLNLRTCPNEINVVLNTWFVLIAMFTDNIYCYLYSVVFFLGSRGFQKVKEIIKFNKK